MARGDSPGSPMGASGAGRGMILPVVDDPVTAEEIGRCLEFRRLVTGMSQKQLAELVGLRKYVIDNWESGSGLLDSVNLWRAFEALHAPLKPSPTHALKQLLRRQV